MFNRGRDFEPLFGMLDYLSDRLVSNDSKYDDGKKTERYKNGRVHGEVRYHDGKTPSEYYIEGRLVTKAAWESYVAELEDNKTHLIYIDGEQITVKGKQFRQIKDFIKNLVK